MPAALFHMALTKHRPAYVFLPNYRSNRTGLCLILTVRHLKPMQNFSHIIEIIENHEAAKVLGREKFKQYRRLGIEPQTFKL